LIFVVISLTVTKPVSQMVSAIEDFERKDVGLYLIAKFHVGLMLRDF